MNKTLLWKGRRVLVTGATGLLGSHMVRELVDRGADLTVVIRDAMIHSQYFNSEYLPNEVYGEIRDYEFLDRVMNEYQPETVFHLAAQTQVRLANSNPMNTLRTNIDGTINVLEAARCNGVAQVIFASSDKAYGSARVLPYNEDSPLHGIHPYDVSKSCGDLIAQMYKHTYGLQIGITRCGNLFGPGDLNFDRLIPSAIRSALRGELVKIRSDGQMIRDYFYVKDAVHAYMRLAEYLFEEREDFIFNFSYGRPLKVIEMAEMVIRAAGDPIRVRPLIMGFATHEIQDQYLDSTKARECLGWFPRWTLEDALEETVKWYRENL